MEIMTVSRVKVCADMKFGIRRYSFKSRVAARTSWKRYARHNLGFKAPRGLGILTNPRKAAYNRIYNRTTVSSEKAAVSLLSLLFAIVFYVIALPFFIVVVIVEMMGKNR